MARNHKRGKERNVIPNDVTDRNLEYAKRLLGATGPRPVNLTAQAIEYARALDERECGRPESRV